MSNYKEFRCLKCGRTLGYQFDDGTFEYLYASRQRTDGNEETRCPWCGRLRIRYVSVDRVRGPPR